MSKLKNELDARREAYIKKYSKPQTETTKSTETKTVKPPTTTTGARSKNSTPTGNKRKLDTQTKRTQLQAVADNKFAKAQHNFTEGYLKGLSFGALDLSKGENQDLIDNIREGGELARGAGEVLSYITPFSVGSNVIGKGATKLLGTGVGKLATKGATKILPKTGANLTKALAENLIGDSTIGLAQNVGINYSEGYRGTDLLKEVAKDQARDFAFGTAFSMLPSLGSLISGRKGAKGVVKNVDEVLDSAKKTVDSTEGVNKALSDAQTDEIVKKVQTVDDVKSPPKTAPKTAPTVKPPTKEHIKQVSTKIRKGLKNTYADNKTVTESINNFIRKGETSEITRQDIEELANIITDNLIEVERLDDSIKEWQQYLRKTNINVPDEVKRNITDYNSFRKSNFGKLKLGKDGANIDSLYAEIQENLGGILPNVNTQEEMLDELSKFMRQGDTVYKTADVYGYEDVYNAILDDVTNMSKLYDDISPNKINALNVDAATEGTVKPKTEPPKQTTEPPKADVPPRTDEEILDRINSQVGTRTKPETRANKIADAWGKFKRSMVDRGDEIYNLSRKTGNKGLYQKYNMTRSAMNRANAMINGSGQYSLNGEKIGDYSLKEIFDPIIKKGDDYYKQFQEYLLHQHNVDRMNFPDGAKPVFADDVTAEFSMKQAETLLKNHPEFAEEAEKVYKYLDNLNTYRVDSGLTSQSTIDMLNDLYPNYVPTHREMPKSSGISMRPNGVSVSDGIKKAKGSDKNIVPLHEQIERMTRQTLSASTMNDFGTELMRTINNADNIKSINKLDDMAEVGEIVDLAGKGDGLAKDVSKKNSDGTYSFFIRKDGEMYELNIDEKIFDAIKPSEVKDLPLLGKGNRAFKSLVTTYNPAFIVRNFLKDMGDSLAFTKQSKKDFIRNYGNAWKHMKTNSDLWQQYKAMGGEYGSFFDVVKQWDEGSWFKRNIADRIEAVNQAVEQAPRFAEFLGTIEKNGNNYDAILEGLQNAQDITVNFGRSGDMGAMLNRNLVPFFNASIQGTTRLAREASEIIANKDIGRLAHLMSGVAIMGVAPAVVNELLFGDMQEYQDLPNNIKDSNFVIPIGNGEFIRLPYGRVVSTISAPIQRGVRSLMGNSNPLDNTAEELVKHTLEQTAPINPIESNIIAPIIQAKNNETWYGTPIVSQSMESTMAKGEEADETTTPIAKAIGKATGVAPKKIDYVLDQYGGILSDVVMPLTTEQGREKGLPIVSQITNAFVTDSTRTNRLGNDYYNLREEYDDRKKSSEGTVIDEMSYKYLNSKQKDIKEVTTKIKNVQNSSLPAKEKSEKLKELYRQRNELYRQAVKGVESEQKTFKKVSDLGFKTMDDYNRVVRSGMSAETYYKATEGDDGLSGNVQALKWLESGVKTTAQAQSLRKNINPNTWEKLKKVSNSGVTSRQLSRIYEELPNRKADTVTKYLDSRSYTRAQKRALFALLNNSKDNPY